MPGRGVLLRRELPVVVYDRQREFFDDDQSWIRGFCGGRGTGKSTIAGYDCLLKAEDGEPLMGVSPTFKDLDDTVWPLMLELAGELDVLWSATKSPLPRIKFRTQLPGPDGKDGRAEISFRTGEKPESLRGPSKAKLWLDEPSIMSADVFRLGLPVLRHRGRMGKLIMSFTPKGRRHWTYGVFYKRDLDRETAKPGTRLIRAHTRDNWFLHEAFYDNIRGQYTSALAAQELAGEFVDLVGLLFRHEWFCPFVEAVPADADRVRYWDKAASIGPGGDASAGVLLARSKAGIYFVEDVVRGRWGFDERNRVMYATAQRDRRRYGGRCHGFFEQEPGSGGKESALLTIRQLAEFGYRADLPSRGKRERTVAGEKLPGEAKVIRARPFAAQAEAGNVRVLLADWNQEWLEELIAFPEYAHDDQVDGTSGAFNKLAAMHGLGIMLPHKEAAPRANAGERYGVHFRGARPALLDRGAGDRR